MGYLHMANLYKRPDFLDLFKTVFVLEKIDGTSGFLHLSPVDLHIHSGCVREDLAATLFDKEKLMTSVSNEYKIHGEFYGGRVQGAAHIYGEKVRFVAFDVKIKIGADRWVWMDVENAAAFCKSLGLEFVYYTKIENTLDNLNYWRDITSVQAGRNGMGNDKFSEGIVVRPLSECFDVYGGRWIVKHKSEKKREYKTPRNVVTDQELKVLTEANEIAEEWVTAERLSHILTKDPRSWDLTHTREVLNLMLEDVKRESEGEVVWSKGVETAIFKHTAALYKERVKNVLQN